MVTKILRQIPFYIFSSPRTTTLSFLLLAFLFNSTSLAGWPPSFYKDEALNEKSELPKGLFYFAQTQPNPEDPSQLSFMTDFLFSSASSLTEFRLLGNLVKKQMSPSGTLLYLNFYNGHKKQNLILQFDNTNLTMMTLRWLQTRNSLPTYLFTNSPDRVKFSKNRQEIYLDASILFYQDGLKNINGKNLLTTLTGPSRLCKNILY